MRIALAAGLAALVAFPAFAQGQGVAERAFPATLAGHAVLPAATFAPPPQGAPPGFALSGRFAGPGNLRVDQPGSIAGTTGTAPNTRPTGLSFPFQGQPVQGFSGIKPVTGELGAYWVLTDNGFGNRRNSSDALLMLHKVRPDFRPGVAGGGVTVEQTIFLADPNRVVRFPIVTDPSPNRFLTGADFDTESLQPVADGFWIGDEFGPFLIKVDLAGRVQQVVETRLDNAPLRGPDHPALQVPASPTAGMGFRARRSGGFEGMALTPDGSRLWAMLEQPLFAPGSDQPEGAFLRVLEFDIGHAEWTGRQVKLRLAPGATAIGDFNLIDDRRALVIERDNGEGDPSLACPAGQAAGQPSLACFAAPARLKRVILVDLGAPDAEGFVTRLGHIDLMAIADPEGLARTHGDRAAGEPRGRFAFPFFTIENVAMVDADHIIVGNDNNLPFSAGRHLTRADDNELVLLRVPELLRAR